MQLTQKKRQRSDLMTAAAVAAADKQQKNGCAAGLHSHFSFG